MNSPYSNDLWIDYKSRPDGFYQDAKISHSTRWFPGKTSRIRRTAVASRKLDRRIQTRGAVRLRSTSARGGPKMGKVSILALIIAGTGSILATTASTGTVPSSKFGKSKTAVLTQIPEAPVPMPTFRFDDADSVASHDLPESKLVVTAPSRPNSHASGPVAYASIWPAAEQFLLDNPALASPILEQSPIISTAPALESSPVSSLQTIEPANSELTSLPPLIPRLQTQELAPAPNKEAQYTTQLITVAPGDTLSGVLAKTSIPREIRGEIQVHELVKKHLSKLRIGTEMLLEFTPDNDLHRIDVKVSRDTRLHMSTQADGSIAIAAVHLPIEYVRAVTSGTIHQSLYLAAEKANLKQSTIMALSDIFEWELDFARDIRKGDSFSMVYDRLYREGEYIGDGDILAAEFVRGNRRHAAVRFTDSEGRTDYYSPDGQSKRRAFMRHPVDVVRITSRFDPNRLHPVLHKIRAHKGVDYGAPYGSPIYATADGKVAFSGTKNAYGRTVILKHGDNRSTLYAHMSKIAKKTASGRRVKRGDVIGYVGKSGRVTGTHLHYEFRIAGKHVDPLKVELPGAPPLATQYRSQLKASAQELYALMRNDMSEHQRNTEQVASID